MGIKEFFSYDTISHINSDSYFEQHLLITIISRISGVPAFTVPRTSLFLLQHYYINKSSGTISLHTTLFWVMRGKQQHLKLHSIQDIKGSLLIPHRTVKIQLFSCKESLAVICMQGKRRSWKIIHCGKKWGEKCSQFGGRRKKHRKKDSSDQIQVYLRGGRNSDYSFKDFQQIIFILFCMKDQLLTTFQSLRRDFCLKSIPRMQYF